MHLNILASSVNVGSAHIGDKSMGVGFNRQLFFLHGAQLAHLLLTFAEAHHTCCTEQTEVTIETDTLIITIYKEVLQAGHLLVVHNFSFM